MTASAPGLVGADGAMSLWKSVLHSLAHRFASSTRDALLEGTRCLARTTTSLRLAANLDDLQAWIRAGHVGAIEATLANLTDGALSLALIPVADVASVASDPMFGFATFVASPANSLARERARMLSEASGDAARSVALHGAAGSGKTHLLRAIAEERRGRDAARTVLYCSAEQLSLDLVSAISSGDIASFRARLMSSSAILIDDLHALAGREATQEELLRSFDGLEERGIPVAVTLARPAERSPGLIEPLRLRLADFESIEVKPPEWETRVAIVLGRIRRWGVEPKPAVAALLATRLRGDLERLDAVLTRLMTQSSCGRGLEDVDVAKYLLSHGTDPQIRVTPEDVLNAVAQQFNVRVRDLRSTSRSPRVTTPRQIAMYLVRRHCGLSYPEIGRRFARHHTTALHSDRVIQEQLGENASLRAAVLLVEKELMRIAEDGG
jgi:chromosomal replication initiator protein